MNPTCPTCGTYLDPDGSCLPCRAAGDPWQYAEPLRTAAVDRPTVPLAGAQLLDRVHAFLGRFVAFPSSDAHIAVTLWAAHAHMVGHFHTTPRLALISPEPESGKTRVLEVLDLLVPAPMMVFGASVAAIFRTLAEERVTLLFDEVDAVFTKRGKDDTNEDLRALLNVGYKRGAAIPRCVGPRHDVVRFDVFAAVALAGIGDLPDTIMTRSVIIRMRRRAASEHIEPFRLRLYEEPGHLLRDRLAKWAAGVGVHAGAAWPELPPGVVDRPAEVWEPLLSVADEAGGHWPTTARAACLEMCRVAEDRQASLGVRLLTDLREVFAGEAMSTADILAALCELDEGPWAELRGAALTSRGLAGLLRRYDVRSVKVKVDGRAVQGYRREHLWDAWERYLPSVPAGPEPMEPAEPDGQIRSSDGRAEVLSEVPDRDQVPEPDEDTEPDAVPLSWEVPQVPEVPQVRGPERGHYEPTT